MNIILFNEQEIYSPLLAHDKRNIHLLKTLHKKEGEYFDAGVLGGKTGRGQIKKIDGEKQIEFSLCLTDNPPPKINIRAAVGFTRPIQLRRILRELCNMGVYAIDLLETDMGDKSYRQTKLFEDGGAQAALLEGAEQARDTILPEINIFTGIENWLKCVFNNDHNDHFKDTLLLAPDNVDPKIPFNGIKSKNNAIIIIGSERGFSDRERAILDNYNFIRFKLGERALRTETACTAAVILAMEKLNILC
ncbi:ribosomal RNA small subunit methyltransferase E [Spirochaetia bacterium]|nr:ribosomal RNA small subunit methyltransferase E [Spirochaetia bacterium]